MTDPVPYRERRKKPLRKPRTNDGGGQPVQRALGEARLATATRRSAPRLNVDHIDMLQETMDGLAADLRFTQKMVDQLRPDELWRDTKMVGRFPNEWIRLRNEYRDKLAAVAIKLAQAGIADRAVKVQEAQTLLLFQRIRAAFERAGADPATIKRVGEELRAISQEADGS